MRRAIGTDFIPGQAQELQNWVKQRVEEEKQVRKDDFEVWMDSIGQAITILAIVFGILLLVINIPRLLGWW